MLSLYLLRLWAYATVPWGLNYYAEPEPIPLFLCLFYYSWEVVLTTKRNSYFLFLFSLGLYKPLLCWVSIFAETFWAYATIPLCLEVLILIILSQRAYTFIFMFTLLFVGGSLDYQKEFLLFILIFTRPLQATVMLSLNFCWDFLSLCDYTSVPWGFNTYYPEPESLYLYFYVYFIIRGKCNSWLPLEEVKKLWPLKGTLHFCHYYFDLWFPIFQTVRRKDILKAAFKKKRHTEGIAEETDKFNHFGSESPCNYTKQYPKFSYLCLYICGQVTCCPNV